MFIKVSSSELNLFFQRVSTMLESGVGLHESILFLEKGETNPKLRLALEGLHKSLASGRQLSRAMSDYPDIFSRLSVELIAVGEQTGMLVDALRRLATISQRAVERRQMLWSAIAYPLCLSVVMLAVVGLFIVFVSPGENSLFGALGDDMPWPSEVLISLSEFLANPTYVTVALVVILIGVLLVRRFFVTNPQARQGLHRVCLSLPVLGPLIARSEIARTLDVLASSQAVGAPLLSSLRSCRSVAGNLEYKQYLRDLGEAVKNGGAFGRSFAAMPYTPRYVGAMLEVSDESGNLDTVARKLADTVEEDLRLALDTAMKLMEPCFLFVSGMAAGFVTIATFLPVVRLVTKL